MKSIRLFLFSLLALVALAAEAQAVQFCNNAWVNIDSTGTTDPITLGTAVTSQGGQTVADCGITDGQTVRYRIFDGAAFEIGTGTYTAAGTTLTRNVTESSNSDTEIDLTANATLIITAGKEDVPTETTPIEASPTASDYVFGLQSALLERFQISALEPAFEGFLDVADLQGFSDVVTLSGTNTGDLTLTSVDAGATSGPNFFIFRNSATPAAGDDLGIIRFRGNDSLGNLLTFGYMRGEMIDPADGTEDGGVVFGALGNGSLTEEVRVITDALIPNSNDGASLGNSTNQWSDGFFASGAVINSGNGEVTLTFAADLLTIAGALQVDLDDEAELRLYEEDAGGANYKGFKSPAAITANTTCTFEDDANFIPDTCVGDGSDDDVPESGDFGNLTGGTGITNSAGTLSVDLTELTSGTFGSNNATTFTYSTDGVDITLDFSTTDGVLVITGGGTSPALAVDDQGALRLYEEDTGGANFKAFAAAAAFTADTTCTFEDDANFIPDTCVGDGTDDDVPESGDFTNLTGGTGVTNSAGTLSVDLTEVTSGTWGANNFTSFVFSTDGVDLTLDFTTTDAAVILSGGGTSPIVMLDDAGALRFLEEDAGGSNYKAFVSPSTLTADTTCTFEDDANFIPDSCVGDGSDDDIPEAADYTNLTGGTGIGHAVTGTLTFDATEISSATWGAGAFTTFTFDAGATDPTLTAGSGTFLLQGVTSFRQADAANAGGQISLLEDPGVGGNFIALLAPAAITSDVTCTLENDANPIPDSCVGNGTDDTAALTDPATLESTDAGATAGPTFNFYRNSATPAAADIIGQLVLQGEDGAGNTQDYAVIDAQIDDTTSTNEDATLRLRKVLAGTMTNALQLGANAWTFGGGANQELRFDTGATDTRIFIDDGGLFTLTGDGTAPAIAIDDEGTFRFVEEDGNGSNYLAIKAPAAVTSNQTCTLENDANFIPDSCVGNGGQKIQSFCVKLGDSTTAITTGDAKNVMHMPYAFTVTAVSASLKTVSSSGTVNLAIREDTDAEGASAAADILSTDIDIEANERRSSTATTQPVVSDSSLAADSEILFDIDTAGTGAVMPLVCIEGFPT